ncbi:unnamed protein product [Chondrus crispus]|uniref:Protein farnesyltransferase/geranylgeranyltransferase type-1 subunit alpha n=1 Tax=Chondrus crispus TaxID=2769 RepID=R7QBF6_CHOCR|nr:unnamed protein product [Chondrus crispus]CDF35394.1 unnamed protein product [Chondrus crispus]|eukprot:XP_005715213.1 unnamed protein product [Chondrus crispus]
MPKTLRFRDFICIHLVTTRWCVFSSPSTSGLFNSVQPFTTMGTEQASQEAPNATPEAANPTATDADNAESIDVNLDEWKGFEYSPVEFSPVLTINLSDEFRHVFGLLYAVKKSKERSKRALDLTSRAIILQNSSPTAWMLRREVVATLAENNPALWAIELGFTAKIISKNEKNYQAWEHRRFAAESGNLLQTEIQFTDVALNGDEKNYHAWCHRHWLVRDHGLTEGELDATEWFIRTDLRNNSAWNHRWLVTGLVEGARNDDEMTFALEIVEKAPRNEAVWNYIHAMGKSGLSIAAAKAKAVECLEVDAGCIPARRFLVLNASSSEASEVRKHCQILASGVDPIRKKYWEMKAADPGRPIKG